VNGETKKEMSQIASFYTLSADKTHALLEAVAPQKRKVEKRTLIFKRKVEETFDGFWQFLREHAREQKEYGYSADGFLDLELILAEKGSMIFTFGATELSQQLSDLRRASIAVFDELDAQKALEMLSRVAITEVEVRQYYQENRPPEYEELGTEAVLAAFEQAKKWLSSVQNDEIGILILG